MVKFTIIFHLLLYLRATCICTSGTYTQAENKGEGKPAVQVGIDVAFVMAIMINAKLHYR